MLARPPSAFSFRFLRNCPCLWLIFFGSPLAAQPLLHGSSEGMAFQVEKVASGLGVPWGMTFLNPRELLFTEREGRAGILDIASGKLRYLQGVAQVMSAGQGGLLDVAVPAGYQDGDWIYFTYSKPLQGQAVTTLARARLRGDSLQTWSDLLVSQSATDTDRHFGSRIAFDDRGHVFFTVGERGVRENAQDLANHAGSVLRLQLDGSVPADNPFVVADGVLANGAAHRQALPEIWSYGHRNPQGICFDAQQQRLWVIEHGPRGGDEINLVQAGRNYGWPVISYGKEYWGPVAVGEGTHKAGMEQPVKVYVPSIAPGSLLLYTGDAFPRWRGNLLAGALAMRHLNRVVVDESARAVAEERLLSELGERIRALALSAEGWLYLSTDSGMILRLRPR